MNKPIKLEESIAVFIAEKEDYFKEWIFNEPVIYSTSRIANLKRLQSLMYKMICHFVTHYDDYEYLMPVSKDVKDVIDLLKDTPYRVGTYRTDFVYDEDKQEKLIEITCRFALNGVFSSALLNKVVTDYKREHLSGIDNIDMYEELCNHLRSYYEESDAVYVLKGEDVRNESKIFCDIFRRIGLPVFEIDHTELVQHMSQMDKALIVSELSFDEIISIPKELLKRLVKLNVVNDFRTVFLIHDKRFFQVLGNKDFQNAILNEEEQAFFSNYYVPTYTYNESPELWQDALANKDQWILKPPALGKSQSIYAGIVTPREEWDNLFLDQKIETFVLQRWIPQSKIKGKIKEEYYEDYITGTLMYFDDNFFGFGDFRTSSYPITNKVDHRKMTYLVIKDSDIKVDCFENVYK